MKQLKIALLICTLIPSIANAAFPAGQWTNEFYSEIDGKYYKHYFCIKQDSTWFGTSYGGNGHWFMKGNDIHLNGKHTQINMKEAYELTKVNSKLLTGYVQQWLDDGSYSDYYTTKWTFTSATCAAPY